MCKNKSTTGIAWCPTTALTSSEVTVLNLCMSSSHALYLYQVCEIIWNDIKVIEWTWFLYWKLQRGKILQKDTISILTIYKITKWHKTEKKCRRSNSSQSKYRHTFICTMFREIISNSIKVIELTGYLCQKLKRGIIQHIMLVEWPVLISAKWLVMLYTVPSFVKLSWAVSKL